MKTIGILFILLFAISSNLFSQLTLEKTLAADANSDSNGWERFNIGYLPDYGYVIFDFEYYQYIDVKTSKIKIYKCSDFSFIKEINLISLGECNIICENNLDKRFNIGISQYLFNQDSKIEFIIARNGRYQVYNEDLSLIQELPYGYYGDGEGLTLIEVESETPTYKLKATSKNESFFYNIVGNPFISKTSTKVPILKSTSLAFSVISNSSQWLFVAKVAEETKGRITVTNTNGQIIKQIDLNGLLTEIPINLQNEANGIYICTLTTNVGKQTVKIIKAK